MFIFPWYSLNDEIQITPNEARNGNADMQRTDHMRYLKVPFAINVMSGGQFQEKQNIHFGGIVDGKKFSSMQESLGKTADNGLIFPEEWGIKMHQHDYYELMYVLDGEVEQQIENSTYIYRKGEGCFINRNTKHREISGKDFFVVYLCLSKECIGELLEYVRKTTGSIYRFLLSGASGKSYYKKDYLYISAKEDRDGREEAYEVFEKMTKELLEQKPGYLKVFMGLVERLFYLLQEKDLYEVRYVTLDSTVEEQVFEKIKDLIEANPKKYSRQELAEQLNYSGDYLNRIVKKYTGLTITAYCQKELLKQAKRMLEEDGLSVTAVMEQLGLHGTSHFYEMFKEEFHMLPGDCKKIYNKSE